MKKKSIGFCVIMSLAFLINGCKNNNEPNFATKISPEVETIKEDSLLALESEKETDKQSISDSDDENYFYESEEKLPGKGRLLKPNEFDEYFEKSVEEVLERFGETLDGEKTVEDIVKNNDLSLGGFGLNYDGFRVEFTTRNYDGNGKYTVEDYDVIRIHVTKNIENFVKDIKIGDSEKHVIKTFYNENQDVMDYIEEDRPLIDYVTSLPDMMNLQTHHIYTN